jgi:hypothetical protein
MKRARPAIILVFAILHLVIGGLGIFIDICSGISQASGGAGGFTGANNPQQAEFQQSIQKTMNEKAPAYNAYVYGNLAVSVFLSISLIVAGIGLLSMKPWARVLSLLYAVVSLLQKVAGAIYMFLFIMPAYDEIAKNLPNDSNRQLLEAALKLGQVMGAVMIFVTMIYPLAVLIAMLTPSARKAMQTTGLRGEFDAGDQEEEVEDYRDER